MVLLVLGDNDYTLPATARGCTIPEQCRYNVFFFLVLLAVVLVLGC